MSRVLALVVLVASASSIQAADHRSPLSAEEQAACSTYLGELRALAKDETIVAPDEAGSLGKRFLVPRAKDVAQPSYPGPARRTGSQGRVVMAGVIGHEGRMESVKLPRSSGDRSLDSAALKQFGANTYVPGQLDGASAKTFLCSMTSFSVR